MQNVCHRSADRAAAPRSPDSWCRPGDRAPRRAPPMADPDLGAIRAAGARRVAGPGALSCGPPAGARARPARDLESGRRRTSAGPVSRLQVPKVKVSAGQRAARGPRLAVRWPTTAAGAAGGPPLYRCRRRCRPVPGIVTGPVGSGRRGRAPVCLQGDGCRASGHTPLRVRRGRVTPSRAPAGPAAVARDGTGWHGTG